MFYPKLLLGKKTSEAKVNFVAFSTSMTTDIDEGLMPIKRAKISYNFNIKNGALCDGYGFEDLYLPKSENNLSQERKILTSGLQIKKLWHFKFYDKSLDKPVHQLMVYASDGQIYWTQLIGITPFLSPIATGDTYPNAVPNALNYRLNGTDFMIFSSSQDGMWKYSQNYQATKIENAPHIVSMCLHYERLFAVVGGEQNRLAFSDDLDPTNWSEDLDAGGFIEMQDERGKLNSVVSFNDYVFVFRDFGVAKVSAYGDQSEFSVSQLFVSSTKIYGNTVCVCGDKILLLTRDGIHMFDGYSTKKLQLGIDELFVGTNNDYANSLYFENKFYLACNLNFNDNKQVGCEAYEGGYKNNALLEYDLTTGELGITRGVDIASMLNLDDGNISKFVACFNGEFANRLGQRTTDGKMFGNPLKKEWISPKSNMGYPTKIKRLKECFIKTKQDCTVSISTESQTKKYFVKGKNISQRVKLDIKGEQIEIGFESNVSETVISVPQITLGVNS